MFQHYSDSSKVPVSMVNTRYVEDLQSWVQFVMYCDNFFVAYNVGDQSVVVSEYQPSALESKFAQYLCNCPAPLVSWHMFGVLAKRQCILHT